MTDFWTYFNSGLNHMLNPFAYTHILLLLALAVPYDFNSWKKLLSLVSLFTLGHAISLLLTVFQVVTIKAGVVNIIIPATIIIIAFRNIFLLSKSGKKRTFPFLEIIAAFLGIIHGLGFSNYFNHSLKMTATEKVLPLFESALGIFSGQIILICLCLILGYVIQTLSSLSKRDWTLTVSAFIIGVLLPMFLQNGFWVK